jgi:hypothetical protein
MFLSYSFVSLCSQTEDPGYNTTAYNTQKAGDDKAKLSAWLITTGVKKESRALLFR